MNAPAPDLTATLQGVRRVRRVSQLELSLRLGVSQRHISFVESGRARPSRELLLAWLGELEAPLAVRNEALLQAGFAPVYGAAPLGDPALAQATEALLRLLEAHDPLPALLLDAHWNVRHLNRGGRWLAAALLPAGLLEAAPLNLLDLMIHPEGFTRRIVNLPEVGPAMLALLRHDAAAQPALAPRVAAFAALLRSRLGAEPRSSGAPPRAPVLTTRFATPEGELAFFSLFTTFGTPLDITLASLRVEHLVAADAGTRARLAAEVR